MTQLLLAALCLGASGFVLVDGLTAPARQRRAALRRALAGGPDPDADAEAGESFRRRVLRPVADRLAGSALRLGPGTTLESVQARLLAAGVRSVTANEVLAAKTAAAAAGLAVGLVSGSTLAPGAALVLAPTLAFLGFAFPDAALAMRARRRAEAVRRELPSVLDLVAVSVEAGLAFDGALAKLGEHMEGPLIDELLTALGEMRSGRARHDALHGVAERVDAPEVASFVRALVQADQLGLPLGRTLRTQAEDQRLRRQAAAEERAMKAPVKMLFPTVLFIFPAMFVVVLGPALLNFQRLF